MRFFEQPLVIVVQISWLLLQPLFVTTSPSPNETKSIVRSKRDVMAKNDEARLIEHLLHGYRARGAGLSRPLADSKDRLTITVKFIINEFEGIEDVAKRMRLAGMLKLTWPDIYLTWDPQEFGGLDVIPLRGDAIYLPVIIRQSSAAEMSAIFAREGGMASLIWVDNKGNVFGTVAGIFKTDCQIDFSWFPFDTQTCDFVFQVWQHSETQLALKIDGTDAISLRTDTSGSQAMWMIDDVKAREAVLSYDIGNFSAVIYTITTSRRSIYYIWNLIVPCAMLSTVQLAAFFMPYSPERVMFAITLVLSLHLFQESVARQLPATAEPIPIVKYSGSQMMIGIMVTIESVLMLYALDVLGRRRVPAWLRKIRNHIYTRSRLNLFDKFKFGRDDKTVLESGVTATKCEEPEKKVPENPSLLNLGDTRQLSRSSSRRNSLSLADRNAGLMTVEEKKDREDEWRDTILMFDRAIFVVCLAATIGIPASVFYH